MAVREKKKDGLKATFQTLRNDLEKRRASEPIIQTRWVVTEYAPGYTESGYYGNDVPALNDIIKYCDTREEADEYVATHESDRPYGVLKIHVQNLRQITTTQWVNY